MFNGNIMTVFYDISRLTKLSSANPKKLYQLFEDFCNKRLYTLSKKLAGSSFILNEKGLLTANVDILYKVQFIHLAAERNYTYYKQYGITYLDRSLYPEINIISTPLITVTKTQIQFPLEEERNTKWQH